MGWGHFSTVWLSHDKQTGKSVALKVQKSAEHYTEAAMDEIEILTTIADHDPKGEKHVVLLLDWFTHEGPNGKHVCMVFELLGRNLLHMIKQYNYKGIPLDIVRTIAQHSLIALDYLHTVCGVIHTDVKPENIMIADDEAHSAALQHVFAESNTSLTSLMAATTATTSVTDDVGETSSTSTSTVVTKTSVSSKPLSATESSSSATQPSSSENVNNPGKKAGEK